MARRTDLGPLMGKTRQEQPGVWLDRFGWLLEAPAGGQPVTG